MGKTFNIGTVEAELYQAASGDWCVSLEDFAGNRGREDFNLGTREAALEFILDSASEVED